MDKSEKKSFLVCWIQYLGTLPSLFWDPLFRPKSQTACFTTRTENFFANYHCVPICFIWQKWWVINGSQNTRLWITSSSLAPEFMKGEGVHFQILLIEGFNGRLVFRGWLLGGIWVCTLGSKLYSQYILKLSSSTAFSNLMFQPFHIYNIIRLRKNWAKVTFTDKSVPLGAIKGAFPFSFSNSYWLCYLEISRVRN